MSSRSSTTDPPARRPGRKARPAEKPPVVPSSSSANPPANGQPLPETVEVGRVVRSHGVRGELVVAVASDVRGRFRGGRQLLLVAPDGSRRTVKITGFRETAGGGLLQLEGVADRDAADALRGSRLEVSRSAARSAPEGSFWWFELVGCRCVDRGEGDLGEVAEILEDGGGLMLRVRDQARRRELLVPWVESFVAGVDVAGRRIETVLPEDFVATCASPF